MQQEHAHMGAKRSGQHVQQLPQRRGVHGRRPAHLQRVQDWHHRLRCDGEQPTLQLLTVRLHHHHDHDHRNTHDDHDHHVRPRRAMPIRMGRRRVAVHERHVHTGGARKLRATDQQRNIHRRDRRGLEGLLRIVAVTVIPAILTPRSGDSSEPSRLTDPVRTARAAAIEMNTCYTIHKGRPRVEYTQLIIWFRPYHSQRRLAPLRVAAYLIVDYPGQTRLRITGSYAQWHNGSGPTWRVYAPVIIRTATHIDDDPETADSMRHRRRDRPAIF